MSAYRDSATGLRHSVEHPSESAEETFFHGVEALQAAATVAPPTLQAAVEFLGGALVEAEDVWLLSFSLRTAEILRQADKRVHARTYLARPDVLPPGYHDAIMDLYWLRKEEYAANKRRAALANPCRPCRNNGLEVEAFFELHGVRVFCGPCYLAFDHERLRDWAKPGVRLIGRYCEHCSQTLRLTKNVGEQVDAVGAFTGLCQHCWLNRAVVVDSEHGYVR